VPLHPRDYLTLAQAGATSHNGLTASLGDACPRQIGPTSANIPEEHSEYSSHFHHQHRRRLASGRRRVLLNGGIELRCSHVNFKPSAAQATMAVETPFKPALIVVDVQEDFCPPVRETAWTLGDRDPADRS
jgi:hypothetical protein